MSIPSTSSSNVDTLHILIGTFHGIKHPKLPAELARLRELGGGRAPPPPPVLVDSVGKHIRGGAFSDDLPLRYICAILFSLRAFILCWYALLLTLSLAPYSIAVLLALTRPLSSSSSPSRDALPAPRPPTSPMAVAARGWLCIIDNGLGALVRTSYSPGPGVKLRVSMVARLPLGKSPPLTLPGGRV
eukprot:CAMPEP_0114118842 /NCGR_PEP_ID=MMETSP0043_2-20121206/5794_1 /TAXON_ID=464988 /ORGANISM="Hemiselmis andersenii, Strain CCMP644" /LENGTH=186 /DNA_ID=CAMNT_0001211351 /DNA_START=303 /DNA_END=864 /DNA_ORIENTATION=-